MQICLKHGINDVLPPLEPHHLAIQSLRGSQRSNCSQQSKENASGSYQNNHQNTVEQEEILKEECNLRSNEMVSKFCGPDFHLPVSCNTNNHEENDHHLSSDVASNNIVSRDQPSANIPSSLLHVHDPCDKTMSLTKRLRLKRKRKKGKGKHKKKSMVDVLAVAKPCTFEQLCRINSLCCSLSTQPLQHEVKERKEINNVELSCESELTKEGLNNRLQADDSDNTDVNMSGRKKWVVKFKFTGHSSSSWNVN